MENQFRDQMSKRTDAELLKIVNEQRNDYQPDAVVAADEELARRNLSQDQVAEAKQELEIKKQFDEKRANEELDVAIKIFTALAPGMLQLILSGAYRAQGYDRKAKELVQWTIYGFVGYFSLVILIIILNRI